MTIGHPVLLASFYISRNRCCQIVGRTTWQSSVPQLLPGFFSLPTQIFPFLFQDYQHIVHTAFLKAEMQKILSLYDYEASALHTSNTESLDGLAFFPICSWPGYIQHLFHKSEIGDTNTFKLVLHAFGNSMSPHLLLNFLFIKYRKNPSKIPKHIHQIQWIIHSIPEKKHLL